MFRLVAGPVLPRTDLTARRWRTMSRCQRRIVSGVTGSRSPWRRAFGTRPGRVAGRARSAQFRFARRGCRRCSTASWRGTHNAGGAEQHVPAVVVVVHGAAGLTTFALVVAALTLAARPR